MTFKTFGIALRRSCFFLALFLVQQLSFAQSPCEISCNVTLPVCSGSAVTLSVQNDYQRTFLWAPGGQTTYSITVRPFETTTYSVTVMDSGGNVLCTSDPFTVEVRPRFNIDFQQIQLTCSDNSDENGKTAQVLAVASGSVEPYTYSWDISPLHISPTNPALAIGLQAYTKYRLDVTDGLGCTQTDSVFPSAYINPRIEITVDPGDTLYLQNPHAKFSFENLSTVGNVSADSVVDISNFFWVLNDTYSMTSSQPEPTFTYVQTGDYVVSLDVYNAQGCDTIYTKTVKVMPVKLKVPNIFTPNGDRINDTFIISLDDSGGDAKSGEHEYDDYKPINTYYETTDLTVFNRWGRIVYHSDNYKNDWDGGSLPDATYFYVLKCHGLQADATFKGSVAIFGSGR